MSNSNTAGWNKVQSNRRPVQVYLFWNEIDDSKVNGDFIPLTKGKLNVPPSIYQMLAFDNPELVIKPERSDKDIVIPEMKGVQKIRTMHLFIEIVSKIYAFYSASSSNNVFAISGCEYMDRYALLQLLREIHIAEYIIVDWPDAKAPATENQLKQVASKFNDHKPGSSVTTEVIKPVETSKPKTKKRPPKAAAEVNSEVTASE
jgi:hypothetical protein